MDGLERFKHDDARFLYPLKQVYPEGVTTPLDMIHRYFMRLYEESFFEPEYVLLCLKDYLELLDETSRLFRFVEKTEMFEIGPHYDKMGQHDLWIKLCNTATGKLTFVSTLPDMPRCKEFTRAHMTFAAFRHETLPELKSGEIVVLGRSDTEKYLDMCYGRKSCE